ncbi:hypothetical protein HD553DRAFT_317672 [Filobasidium floriforme]|uniref:uncharacterized protein n=1 Tax=Filobasidium floriforme TaxID=5210 RepID=UPI001E8EC309|nr:uncharacterized protein HD553DRAFT_317672 [Filobasidium floriforme]KAH8080203.1 hypothetical protein HD553DRAFT_317672 [Filobasidium floriforme]
MSSANPAVAAALTAVESRRAAQRQAELEELESDLDNDNEVSDESDEEEDEYGEELTPAMDAAILRTLRLIRSGKGVYEGEKVIEEALKDTSIQAETLKLNHPRAQAATKKFTLQDHQRAALLASSHSNFDSGQPEVLPDTLIPLTHVQEERQLREEVTRAFHTAIPSASGGGVPKGKGKGEGEDEDEDEDEDDFLVTKTTLQVDDAEAKKYRDFLLAQAGGEEGVREILGMGGFPERMQGQGQNQGKRAIKAVDGEEDAGDADVDVEDAEGKEGKGGDGKRVRTKDDDEEFLMNYILNRGWIDPSDEAGTTSHAGEFKPKKQARARRDDAAEEGPNANPWGTLEDDSDFDEKAEEFENTYNFRFEEPGAANITTHARNLTTTARRTDETRKTARQLKAERKAEQAAQRAEQTKQEKGKKRREIEKRMEALRKELGDKAFGMLEEEMEGDWDEEVFDRAMDKVLAAGLDDDEKPTWGDDIDTAYAEDDEDEEGGGEMDYAGEGEEYPEFDQAYAPGGDAEEDVDMEAEEPPLNMDADFISIDDATSKRKQRKEKKNKKKDKGKGKERVEDVEVEEEQGLTVAQQKEKVKQALEEYKKLDYEDMIGDLPTRFKYQKAAPQDYGLTPAEILLATDAELNQFLGMKHYAPYRHGSGVGAAGRGMRDRLKELKAKLAKRKWGEVPEDEEATGGRSRDQGWGQNKGGQGSSAGPAKKRKGKKERQKQAAAAGADVEGGAAQVPGPSTGTKRKNAEDDRGEGASKRQRA